MRIWHPISAALFAGVIAICGLAKAADDAVADAPMPPECEKARADDPLFAAFTWDPDQIIPTWHPTPDFSMRLRGRIDTDAIWTKQSPGDIATFGDIGDAVGLRRARIGVEGTLPDGRYVAEIDLATGAVVPKDVFVGLYGDDDQLDERRGGHFREPFSLEGGTSANTFAFLERSPANMFDPGRNWGMGLFHNGCDKTYTLDGGVFQDGTDPSDFEAGPGSTVGFTGRLTVAPIDEAGGERLLHFAVALSGRIPEAGVIVINQQPRSGLLELGDSSSSDFVPKIVIPATFEQLFNLQFASACGPAWTEAEWYGTLIDQIGGGPVFYHGCYVDCGYFLTGEHREYSATGGVFGPVKVEHPLFRDRTTGDRTLGFGGWEIVARFSYLDLFSPNTPLGPSGQLQGTRLPLSTFGVNWYWTDHVRVMFDYSYAVPIEPNTGSSDVNEFATRLNIFW